MLTAKQIRFGEEYVIDMNGTQAYKRAGYSAKSDDVAAVEAFKLLRNPKIQKFIEELQEELRRKTKLTAEMVIEELRDLGFYSIKDFVNADNTIKKLHTLSREKLKPIVGIKVKETTTTVGKKVVREVTTELKLADKRASVVDLGRHTGIFKEDNEQRPVASSHYTDEQFEKLLNAARQASADSGK